MLRTNRAPWWQRLFAEARISELVPVRPDSERRCPQCATHYDASDRYCPGCHLAVPEWQFG
ncbi:MAG: hypothetical protein HUU14_07930 [Dehalococcoidia bacterium]|nr:hypothetical protein [Dehalococcoidia bacterium]MCL4232746.1 hypothetical protein [Dehalococcoidia bacterium]NUQ55799.1 hypothetical protein [Dehalococcoidia bacterium]